LPLAPAGLLPFGFCRGKQTHGIEQQVTGGALPLWQKQKGRKDYFTESMAWAICMVVMYTHFAQITEGCNET
jgi:hypothetical protein